MRHLTDDELRAFGRDGYLVVPGVVDEDLLAAADEEVDRLVAAVEPKVVPEGGATAGRYGWFEPVATLPRCDDALRRSGALDLAADLVAPRRLDHRFDHIQVATTVPPHEHVPGGGHIDGHAPGDDPPASFTVLAGILLTDQVEPRTGNLWVWPGSHLAHARLFEERGTRALQDAYGHTVFLAPPFPLGPPVEVRGRRGDLLLSHFLTSHNGGGNTAGHERRTIYCRLAAAGHAERWEATFLDPLLEYEPVRRALAAAP